jgi:spore maturation protein CgeB
MSFIKKKIKNISWIYSLNALLKSKKEKDKYNSNSKYYLAKKNENVIYPVLRTDSSLNIFYLGTDELQDKGGILQGLEPFGNVYYFTKSDGGYGQYIDSSIDLRKQKNASRLKEIFKELENQKSIPKILFAQTFSTYIDANIFKELKEKYGILIINIGMDDRHQFKDNILELIPHLDLALTAAPECVEWYLKEGCPAIFFPEASDENIYHPMPNLLKKHDVSFVGAKYGIREKIVLALRNEGIQVTAYGSGWGTGFLPVSEVPKLFAESKIVLGVGTIGHSHDFYALKMRDFDGPMSGSCYLTHDNSDLYSLFEIGKEIVTYKDIAECVEKVKYLLKNESEREAIARAGYIRAKAEHTWTIRFKNVLDIIFEK